MEIVLPGITALLIQACPFNYKGEQYSTVTIEELSKLYSTIITNRSFQPGTALIIKFTATGCMPDDGQTIPGPKK